MRLTCSQHITAARLHVMQVLSNIGTRAFNTVHLALSKAGTPR
jgi:hypothetical protein